MGRHRVWMGDSLRDRVYAAVRRGAGMTAGGVCNALGYASEDADHLAVEDRRRYDAVVSHLSRLARLGCLAREGYPARYRVVAPLPVRRNSRGPQILELLDEGVSVDEIAARLGVGVTYVRATRRQAFGLVIAGREWVDIDHVQNPCRDDECENEALHETGQGCRRTSASKRRAA